MTERLPGGNMNAVERDGGTVTRNAGPWTPTVHRHLRCLDRAGVHCIPRPPGIEGATERLSFVGGGVPLNPLLRHVLARPAAVGPGVLRHPGRGRQRRSRVQVILTAYGTEAGWDDVLRVAAVARLWDLADLLRVKAVELGKPDLDDDAGMYERDAKFLAALREGREPSHGS